MIEQQRITTGYKPRDLQATLHSKLKRFNVIVLHRRAGKSVFAINEMIDKGLRNPLKNPQYAYFAPFYGQAKRVMWDYLKDYTKSIPGVTTNEAELRVEIPRPATNDKIRFMLLGADNPAAIRGIYLDGAILDEYAEMDPTIWGEVVRPTLSDRLGWAILMGCVTKDTLIIGENGLEEIGTCPIGYTDENKQIYGLGGFHKAENRYGNPILPTIKITTKAGLELEGTPNHRIWTPDGWIRLDELKKGQPTYLQYNQQVYGTGFCDLDWAWFLGLYLAEGSTEKDRYRVTITSGDEFIHSEMERLYGFKRSDKFHSRKNSKEFLQQLHRWFPCAGSVRAKQKTLSKAILGLNKECLRSFVSGYFDGDGTVGNKSITCTTSSPKLSRQMQALLLNMGYRAARSISITKPTELVKVESICHKIAIESESAFLFSKQIGFRLKKHTDKTLDWEPSSGHRYWFNRKDFGMLSNKFGYLGRCKKISSMCLNEIDPDGKIYDKNLLADEIKTVEHSNAETFDFCIPDTHSYFSNGLVSHNTPRGFNHFKEIYDKARANELWFAALYKASETKIIPKEELDAAKSEMDEAQYSQEFECSFTAALVGSYYGKYMEEAEEEGRITSVPYDKNLLVDTYWDLGVGDTTSIWYLQQQGKNYHLIDYSEDSGKGLEFYVREVKSKPYTYGYHTLPHDAAARSMETGRTRQQTLTKLGLKTLIQKRQSVDDGIHAVRMILNRCWFDRVKCERGISALKSYERKWDAKNKIFDDKPKHNWASNGSDAFRYLALGTRDDADTKTVLPRNAESDYNIFSRDGAYI